MASPAQTLANQQNAARSTGPTTPEGKSVSSKNATRHGLTGAFTVLPHESQEEFDQLAAAVRNEFAPETDSENFLVNQMAQARWKLDRIQRLEAQAFEQVLTEPGAPGDPDARILAAIGARGNLLDKLQRYSSAAERSYYKARRELEAVRKDRFRAEDRRTIEDRYQQVAEMCAASLAQRGLQNEPNFDPSAAPKRPQAAAQPGAAALRNLAQRR
jgi:hypothetical protein